MLENEFTEDNQPKKDIFADIEKAKIGSFIYINKERSTVYGPFNAYDFEAREIFKDLKARDLISYFRFTHDVTIVDGDELYTECYRFAWTAKTGWRLPEHANYFSNFNIVHFLCTLCGMKQGMMPIKISGKALHKFFR